jgi:hypothetical protein
MLASRIRDLPADRRPRGGRCGRLDGWYSEAAALTLTDGGPDRRWRSVFRRWLLGFRPDVWVRSLQPSPRMPTLGLCAQQPPSNSALRSSTNHHTPAHLLWCNGLLREGASWAAAWWGSLDGMQGV